MVTRILSGPVYIATLSSLFLDLLLSLFAFRVSFKVTETFSYSAFALSRLSIRFALTCWGQTGSSYARREDAGTRAVLIAVEIQRWTMAILWNDRWGFRSLRSSLLFLLNHQVLQVWHSLEENFRVVSGLACIGD